MNITTLIMALIIPAIVKRIGTRMTYASFLMIGGLGFVSMLLTNNLYLTMSCMVLVGIGWSAIITIPFIMTTTVVSPARIGVYMGLLNAFICIPQIFEMFTIGTYYDSLLGGDARNALVLAGICLILGGIAALFISKSVDDPITGKVETWEEAEEKAA